MRIRFFLSNVSLILCVLAEDVAHEDTFTQRPVLVALLERKPCFFIYNCIGFDQDNRNAMPAAFRNIIYEDLTGHIAYGLTKCLHMYLLILQFL